MFPWDPELLLQVLGLAFIAVGLAVRMGLWKKWYWKTRGTVYGYIPLGLLFLIYSFNDLAAERLGSRYFLFQVAIGLVIALGLWWSVRPPELIKPAWVRWVERHSQAVRLVMAQDADQDKEWERHVASPEAVDAWAKALQRPKAKRKE
jgi:hypothetical protein